EPRVIAFIVGVFAWIALIVAGVGVYGLMSYTVESRRTELGVRVALGAGGREIFGLVFSDGLRIAAVGVAAGLAGAALLAPLVRSLLFGIPAADPTTFIAMAVTLVVVTIAATIVP